MPVARLDFRNHRPASLLLAAFVASMAVALRSSRGRFDEMLHGAPQYDDMTLIVARAG